MQLCRCAGVRNHSGSITQSSCRGYSLCAPIVKAMVATAVSCAGIAIVLGTWAHYDPALHSTAVFIRFLWDLSTGKVPWWGDARVPWRCIQLTGREVTSRLTLSAEKVATRLLGSTSALRGKVAVVTGASAGIGMETARVLMLHGCHVVLAVRNISKGEDVLAQLQKAAPGGQGTVMELDTSNLDSVKAFAKHFVSLNLPVHFLVLNAGIMALDTEAHSAQGFELQFATNYLGHFLLARLLEKPLLASGTIQEPSRLVILSSAAGCLWFNVGSGSPPERLVDQIPPTRPYNPMMNYGLTKSLLAMLAKEQQRRWGPSNSVAVAVHPGISATNLLTGGSLEGIFMGWPYAPFRKTTAQAASTSIYACLSPEIPEKARNGEYWCHSNAVQQAYANPETLEPGVAEEAWRLSEALVQRWL